MFWDVYEPKFMDLMVNPIINWLFEQAVDPKYQFQWTLSKQTGPLAIIARDLFI